MDTTGPSLAQFTSTQVILFSADVERTASFYCWLGFEETFRVPTQGPPIHVDVMLDGYRIGFASMASARDDHGLDPVTTGQRGTVILETGDVVSAYRTLTDAGVPGLSEPAPWLGRLLIAWVADPDGHPIQLVQELDSDTSSRQVP